MTKPQACVCFHIDGCNMNIEAKNVAANMRTYYKINMPTN